MKKEICNMDCLNCIYPYCIYDVPPEPAERHAEERPKKKRVRDKEKQRLYARKWYHAHKDDPGRREKTREYARRYWELHKDDPEYIRKNKERAALWKERKNRETQSAT